MHTLMGKRRGYRFSNRWCEVQEWPCLRLGLFLDVASITIRRSAYNDGQYTVGWFPLRVDVDAHAAIFFSDNVDPE